MTALSKFRFFVVLFLACVVFDGDARARETAKWPQFRGPDATGVAPHEGFPEKWSATENVAWFVTVPGRGWSCPIVWGDRVFLTTAVGDADSPEPTKGLYFGGDRSTPPEETVRWLVVCLDFAKGGVLWEAEAHRGRPANPVHVKNTFASETPVTDGERVYAYFGNVGLFTFDMGGKKLWEKRWDAVRTRYGWGHAASPAVHEGRVYLVNDNEDGSFITALDARSGDELWRQARDEKSNWSTPFVWRNDLRAEVVTAGTGKVRSYGLDGKLLWELAGMSRITIATPYAAQGLLYISSGFVMDQKRPVYAIRPGARDDISLADGQSANAHIAWAQPKAGPYNPSTLVYRDHLFVLLDQGFFACYDARTGKEVYQKQRIDRGAGAFTASPWAADGKVYCLSEDGDTYVIPAGGEFKVTGVNRLGEMCMATPALAESSLLIRTLTKLYRIGGGQPPRSP